MGKQIVAYGMNMITLKAEWGHAQLASCDLKQNDYLLSHTRTDFSVRHIVWISLQFIRQRTAHMYMKSVIDMCSNQSQMFSSLYCGYYVPLQVRTYEWLVQPDPDGEQTVGGPSEAETLIFQL